MLLKKIIVGLMLGFFLLSNCIMFCASSELSSDEIIPTPTVEVEVPVVEDTEPIHPPIIFVSYSYIEGLSRIEIENQITALYDYISYLENACQIYSEVAAEIANVKEIISQYESRLAEIIEKENHYNRCYAEYPLATTIWFYMKENFGWSDAVCAGVMGNIMAEVGGGSPEGALLLTAWESDSPHGLGLFQWTGTNKDSRRMKIKATYGEHPTIEEQLQFMYYEVTGSNETIASPRYCEELSVMFTCDSPERNAMIFAIWFEGCNSAYRYPRQSYARYAYNYFVY